MFQVHAPIAPASSNAFLFPVGPIPPRPRSLKR
jgi:hypothetical protein